MAVELLDLQAAADVGEIQAISQALQAGTYTRGLPAITDQAIEGELSVATNTVLCELAGATVPA